MELAQLANGIATWMCLVALLSFHEFAHAWTANRCGDDTARLMGRLTINPIVHIDPIGTVLIPLFLILSPTLGIGLPFLIFGWAKPVPFNPSNLGNRTRDEILIAMAGPAMNLVLAVILMAVCYFAGVWPEKLDDLSLAALSNVMEQNPAAKVVFISLILCFFNLIPVPPLDGSHVLRHVVRMSEETYLRIAGFGFVIIILLLNFTPIGFYVWRISIQTMVGISTVLGFSM